MENRVLAESVSTRYDRCMQSGAFSYFDKIGFLNVGYWNGVADNMEVAQINLIEKAFRGPITTAINRELNFLRKNNVKGRELLKSLGQIYFQHNMRDWIDSRSRQMSDDEVPRIICSEGLM